MQLGVNPNAPVATALDVPHIEGVPAASASRSHIRALLEGLLYQGGYRVESFVGRTGLEQLRIEDLRNRRN